MLVQSIRSTQATFKDLFVPVVRTAADEAAIAFADQLAARAEGGFTALLTQPLPAAFYAADPFSTGELWGAVLAELRQENDREVARLKQRLAKATSTTALRATALDDLIARETVVMSARHADLTILQAAHDEADRAFRGTLVEAVLFQSGRPMLIVPPGYQKSAAFERVVIGWNASREAARAVGDAASILEAAKTVTIVTVDAKSDELGVEVSTGRELAAHLSRRGVNVEVRNELSQGRPQGDVLLDIAAGLSADVIVLGGYGHSRARELVLGGVTRELLRSADRPLFMSH
ncbi:MAG: universal stress protein [Alphaproteobacteria bacterium]